MRPDPYGFTAWPPSVDQPLLELVDRKFAHSDRFALPRMIAPADRRLAIRQASRAAAFASAGEPAVAGIPRTAMLSLISTGIPASGPGACPAARAASLAAASAAAAALTVVTARSSGFSRSILAR